MKQFIGLCSLFCLVTSISVAQQKSLQSSFNISPLDAHAAAEFSLSENSTLYTAIGFGYGSVNGLHLKKYYEKSFHHLENSDIPVPQMFLAPYLNIQYRNYLFRRRENSEGYYTGSNSGLYTGARLKMQTAPVLFMHDEERLIKQSYMLGAMFGWQKAIGTKRRFLLNAHTGVTAHSNYNLSFFGYKAMLYGSIGYIVK
ncbi:MAG: hypothetical protein EOO43_15420 [Flavobacterium sp.]|nr:MAG: hypothetical protein EOO43_15420 [Flavobacterium sp.]